MKILGIDIHSGNINSKSQARYSIALLENGEFKLLKEDISKIRLIHLIRKIKPDIIACDNIFELFPKEKIKRFFYLLPPESKVVQVTGKFGQELPLLYLARKHGIEIKSKHDSLEEAKASALLAYKKVGFVIKIFEDKCKIIVSRARSPTKGGQSENRFRRKIHGMVWQHIKYVKEKLDELNLKYELKLIKADGGYSKGEFLVYAPREKLIGIRKKKGGDVQIKILPVEMNEIEFEPLSNVNIPVIIGIDPGATVAIAVIDINGKLLDVYSAKNLSLENIINFTSKYKRILICASDVYPAPRIVERVASIHNAILFSPQESLSIEEKIKIVDETYGKDCYSNNHERDAIASALKAYKYYKNKIENILKKIENLEEEKRYEILERVLKGEVLENVIREIKDRNKINEKNKCVKKPEEKEIKVNVEKYLEEIKKLKYDVEILKRENEELKRLLQEKEMEIQKLKRKIEDMKSELYKNILIEREIRKRDKIIKDLVQELNALKKERDELIRTMKKTQEKVPDVYEKVYVLENLSWNSLKNIQKENIIIFIKDPSGGGKKLASELMNKKPKAIITTVSKMSHIVKNILKDILIDVNEIDLKRINDKYYVNKEDIDKLLNEKKKRLLEDLIKQFNTFL